MKYCSKCGKELMDEAVICVGCGCAVETDNKANAKSADYSKLMAFTSEANGIFVFGILSLALSLGIGLIFQIINMVKVSKYRVKGQKEFNYPQFNLTDRNDILAYESAKKKIKTGDALTAIGFAITWILISIAFGAGIAAALS